MIRFRALCLAITARATVAEEFPTNRRAAGRHERNSGGQAHWPAGDPAQN